VPATVTDVGDVDAGDSLGVANQEIYGTVDYRALLQGISCFRPTLSRTPSYPRHQLFPLFTYTFRDQLLYLVYYFIYSVSQ
jgi:hypothetical protein